MPRLLLSLLAGAALAIVGAGAMAMTLGILFTAIGGSFEGSAAMGGVALGLPLGTILGFVLGFWLVFRLKRWKAHDGL